MHKLAYAQIRYVRDHLHHPYFYNIANYDGTDMARPCLVDNSTGTPVYTYLDKDFLPSLHAKRAAILHH